MRKVLLLLMFSALLGAGNGLAQSLRPLPPKSERGLTGPTLPMPMVEIDGKILRLAPGALIHDQNNRTIVHAQLPPNSPVVYALDAAGNVQRIVILTPIEQAQLDRAGK